MSKSPNMLILKVPTYCMKLPDTNLCMCRYSRDYTLLIRDYSLLISRLLVTYLEIIHNILEITQDLLLRLFFTFS